MTGLRGTISMITVDHSELRTGSGRTIPSLTEGGKLMRQEGFGIRRKGDPLATVFWAVARTVDLLHWLVTDRRLPFLVMFSGMLERPWPLGWTTTVSRSLKHCSETVSKP